MTTTIQIQNLNYQFPNTNSPVFSNNSLSLIETIDSNTPQQHLYGIIGPSGVGKTTLLSILGGQLKPDVGQILINEQDIYTIIDTERRQLIAYQLQTATNLRGNVRTNLVFGIYNHNQQQEFTDDYLIDLLQQVGLWNIFIDKDGLDTIIGEGGLNLSGGQRQRLNFASLYLRATYYKPAIVLIDEPTSSLDEISEKSITHLISQLATQSLVLVVAHRLVTLRQAKGIIDLSNINPHDTIQALDHATISKQSQYFQDLENNRLDVNI
jgi:ATP-binding cassette, subfamily B, bacterial PglK